MGIGSLRGGSPLERGCLTRTSGSWKLHAGRPPRRTIGGSDRASYLGLFLVLAWQALRGEPLLRPGALTQTALAGWLIATLCAGVLANVPRRAAHLIAGALIPLLLAIAYAALIGSRIGHAKGGFGSLASHSFRCRMPDVVEDIVPIFFVADVRKLVEWYERVLGVRVAFIAEGYAGVELLAARIHLSSVQFAPLLGRTSARLSLAFAATSAQVLNSTTLMRES